jgi:hypothetical protein
MDYWPGCASSEDNPAAGRGNSRGTAAWACLLGGRWMLSKLLTPFKLGRRPGRLGKQWMS